MSKEVKVSSLPPCDICKNYNRHSDAYYDSRIVNRSSWAFMCAECYVKFGVPTGTGRAQRLILANSKDN